VRVECTAVYTNKTYCGAFRGFGVPQVTFASESQMDELAAALGMDPLELRRRNALRAGQPTATGQVFAQSVGIGRTIEEIAGRSGPLPGAAAGPRPGRASASGFAPPAGGEARPPGRLADGRYLYGRGVACLLQGISNGAEGVDVVGASVQVSQDGSALVGVGLTELGQGSRTVYAQVASEVLGIGLGRITVRQVDTDAVHDSGPTVASRSTTVGGMAVLLAAREVARSLVSMAALMFKCPEEGVRLAQDCAVPVRDPQARLPLSQVATAAYWTGFPLMHLAFSHAPDARFDHETHQGDIYIAYNFGTHLMDVQVDRWTGRVRVLRHLAAHDVGRVVNPLGLEGQVEGGSLIGFGLAHLERIQTEGGRIRNANFADYAVPSILDRLPTETITVEDPSPVGPFGAKGAGEPPVAGAAAAFANAVADATGVRFTRLPITRADIAAALGREV
jgi:CO/xanthine dehydrogenase Mo-binding subunit